MVLIGVAGEIALEWKHEDGKRARLKKAFWILLVIGLMLEIPDAAKTDKEAADARLETAKLELKIEQTKPENQPIRTISAFARILVKGDKWVRRPNFDDNWIAFVEFIAGTNLTGSNVFFGLSATKSDIQLNNILGTLAKNRTDREYDIAFHQGHPVSDLPNDAGFGKPANSFSTVTSLAFSMPQFETLDELHFSTNTKVLSGSVVVTINSSMTWEFEIPPQMQKFGSITSMKTTNAEGKVEIKIMPVHVVDIIGRSVGFFDGK